MKVRILLLVFVVVVALSSVPAIAAPLPGAVLVDAFTPGNIFDPWFYPGTTDLGRWHDERGSGDGYMVASAMSAPCAETQDGSIGIDYSVGASWDREIRGYFKVGPEVEPQYAPVLPDLEGKAFMWWQYKGNVAANPNFAEVDEHVQQLIIFSPTGLARYEVKHATEAGWRLVMTPEIGVVGPNAPFDNWSYEGNFLAEMANVDCLNFWTSAWDNNEGNLVLIDDIHLIPEPATMSLLGLGALALLKRRKA